MKASAAKSHGRKSIRPTLQPRALMDAPEDLAHAWRADVLTLFADQFPGILGVSLTGKALKNGLWQLHTHDLRSYGEGRHRNVDDTPAGGGPGMVMRADVLGRAIADVLRYRRCPCPIIYMSPRGAPLTQARAQSLANGPGAVILCGRFEGVDQRVLDHFAIEELSIGDYVLSGGELAAQAMLDATVRLIPGVLGNNASIAEESFANGLLEHPQYTRPNEWEGRKIPDVLISGNHQRVAQWRSTQAKAITKQRRPDLWQAWKNQHG